MVDPGGTLGLDAETIFGSRELIGQTQTVGAMGINMHLHRDSLVVESREFSTGTQSSSVVCHRKAGGVSAST